MNVQSVAVDGVQWQVARVPKAAKAKGEVLQAARGAEGPGEALSGEAEKLLAVLKVPAPRPKGAVVAPDPAEGAGLAKELDEILRRYILIEGGGCSVCVLWMLHTFIYDAILWTPYLMISSPVPGCGKSTMRELFEDLTFRGLHISSPSAAAAYRFVDAIRPTLLIDEWDAISPEARDAFIHVLNSGTSYKGNTSKCNKETNKPEIFRTYCPKAIFGIGGTRLPPATVSRIIEVVLQRAVSEDNLARVRGLDFRPLYQRLVAWREKIWNWACVTEPEMPKTATLRSRDVWEPLFLMAQACGPKWQERCEQGMLEVLGMEEPPTPESVKLLHAVRAAFAAAGDPEHQSAQELLLNQEVRAACKNPHVLATKMRLFGVRPSLRRLPDGPARVYALADLAKPVRSYGLPPL